MSYNIAIDGPAGAGKSTIAKLVASKLGFVYVDTGAMFRALAVYCIDNGIDISDEEQVGTLCKKAVVDIAYEGGIQQVLVNGENVTDRLRREETGKGASVIAAYGVVRDILKRLQQSIASSKDIVMDGRDIGTCVLPNAICKIYLTASVRTRALRRFKELEEKGAAPDLSVIEKDIEDRDYRDMHREIAPLTQAEDAFYLDSSDMNIDEVAEAVIEEFERRKSMA